MPWCLCPFIISFLHFLIFPFLNPSVNPSSILKLSNPKVLYHSFNTYSHSYASLQFIIHSFFLRKLHGHIINTHHHDISPFICTSLLLYHTHASNTTIQSLLLDLAIISLISPSFHRHIYDFNRSSLYPSLI